jgi:hypothetical protein
MHVVYAHIAKLHQILPYVFISDPRVLLGEFDEVRNSKTTKVWHGVQVFRIGLVICLSPNFR